MPSPSPSELKRLVNSILHSQADLAQVSRKKVKETLIADHDVPEGWFEEGDNKKAFKEAVNEAVESHPSNKEAVEDKPVGADEAKTQGSRRAQATSEKAGSPASEAADEDGSAGGQASEMSSLEDSADESSRRASKSKAKGKGAKKRASSGAEGSKAKKGRGSSTSAKGAEGGPIAELEEEIRRLKKYVAACGVRKVWVKLYAAAGCDGPSEADLKGQIKVIRGVLSDLGMDGRLSMEKAKQIKEKREFESEVAAMQAEAPVHLKAGGLRSGRRIGRKGRGQPSDDDEDEEDDVPNISRSVRNSLSAFAADLNDSD